MVYVEGGGYYLKNRPRIKSQLIIACSANSDSVTMMEAFNAGVDEFVMKPLSWDCLEVVLSNAR